MPSLSRPAPQNARFLPESTFVEVGPGQVHPAEVEAHPAVDFGEYFSRLGAFVVAQLRSDSRDSRDPRLVDIAGRVRLDARLTAKTVREAVEGSRQRGWNSFIYEAWALGTADGVREVMAGVPGLVSEALAIYADLPGLLRDSEVAWEAIEEARQALYGEPEVDVYSECHGGFDGDPSGDDVWVVEAGDAGGAA